jgi:hypothetical protein
MYHKNKGGTEPLEEPPIVSFLQSIEHHPNHLRYRQNYIKKTPAPSYNPGFHTISPKSNNPRQFIDALGAPQEHLTERTKKEHHNMHSSRLSRPPKQRKCDAQRGHRLLSVAWKNITGIMMMTHKSMDYHIKFSFQYTMSLFCMYLVESFGQISLRLHVTV